MEYEQKHPFANQRREDRFKGRSQHERFREFESRIGQASRHYR
jgi:hypothetical protein